MGKTKVTSSRVATKAAKVLKSKSTGKNSKTAAASALAQTKAPTKVTSKKTASIASQVLRDKRTSKSSKSVAGSALSQTQRKVKK